MLQFVLILVVVILFIGLIREYFNIEGFAKGSAKGFAKGSAKGSAKGTEGFTNKDKLKNLPIREFTVRSSFNSAIRDNVASTDAIKYVLEKGCRLIDFEIYTRDNIEYVSYSGDPEFKSLDTENTPSERLSLGQAFSTVAGNAFTNPSPFPEDPLFILLRIKNNSSNAYSRIAQMIETSFKTRLYNAEVNRGTKLKSLMGKVIIMIDIQSSPQYKNDVKCSSSVCHRLEDYVSIEAGSVHLPKYTFSDLTTLPAKPVAPDSDFIKTNIKSFMMITPNQVEQIKPLDPDVVLNTWHPQFLLVKYSKDTTAYDKIFNDYGSSFVPMAHIVKTKYGKNSAQDV
jgi:hypothetical protein